MILSKVGRVLTVANIDGTEDRKMKSFKEFDEAATLAQRQKMKLQFKKNKAKIMRGRKLAAKKLASPEKLKAKAQKKARDMILKKFLKDKGKDELSFSARQGIEKKVDAKSALIKKIAKRILPKVKKADREKLKKKQGGNE